MEHGRGIRGDLQSSRQLQDPRSNSQRIQRPVRRVFNGKSLFTRTCAGTHRPTAPPAGLRRGLAGSRGLL